MNIIEVASSSDKKAFIDFPHLLYQGDPNYVPELYLNIKEMINRKKNPFFQHSEAIFFLAKDGQQVIGRIAAVVNNNYNKFADENAGFFGFFDCIDQYDVAKKLLDTACDWCKAKGLTQVLGPTNLTTNDPLGVLVQGYDRPPVILTTYNKPYYNDFLDRYGFKKKMDLLAYYLVEESVDRRSIKLSKSIEQRLAKKGITIRTANMKDFYNEAKRFMKVYQSAWSENWGFVPPTEDEIKHIADSLKLVVDPEFALFAEHEGNTIGFALALPNINEVTINFRKGRLLPFNIFKLLLGKSKLRLLRIFALGVEAPYRKMGIEGVFYGRIIGRGIEKGYNQAEASWILEDNVMMNQGLINLNAKEYKRYRIYNKDI